MSKYKTEFELREGPMGQTGAQVGIISIVNYRRYKMVKIENINGGSCYMKTKDLERFAVNILRALKSKKLSQLKPPSK